MGNVRNHAYRTSRTKLVYLATRFWRRRKTREALLDNYQEIATLRYRVRCMANEIQEWRWKVGGVAYKVDGQEAHRLVADGMRNKGYPMVGIDDADLRPIEMEPRHADRS